MNLLNFQVLIIVGIMDISTSTHSISNLCTKIQKIIQVLSELTGFSNCRSCIHNSVGFLEAQQLKISQFSYRNKGIFFFSPTEKNPFRAVLPIFIFKQQRGRVENPTSTLPISIPCIKTRKVIQSIISFCTRVNSG